ncbi:MAG TPA: hypothetical protein VJN63_11425, partial [Thermoplasmata archaeon]|nr:hypothetical protein [Thermoplasmata archaeon]
MPSDLARVVGGTFLRFRCSRPWCTLVALAIVAVSMAALPAQGHDDAAIDSFWSISAPAVDGNMSVGEWADAAAYDLSAIPGNVLAAYMLIKNTDSFLWFAYDAVGDTTEDPNDTASFSFDTNHDGIGTTGREDQFVHGYLNAAHLVFSISSWVLHDSPFDTSLPNHAGLAASRGFGASPLDSVAHRIYEFQVPLALLGLSPGGTIGLFGGSIPAPGVVDLSTYAYSTWPYYVPGPIPLASYGDLTLGSPPSGVGVVITPSIARMRGNPGESVRSDLLLQNAGTTASDTFDITSFSDWPITFYDASGTTLLADTDGDGTPDTGNVTIGGIVPIVVQILMPLNATGCANSTVIATSSWDIAVNDTSILRTCTAPAQFTPPHSDFGVDTDSPANGLFDLVQLNVNLTITDIGSYLIEGAMFNFNGTVFIDAD